MQSANSATNPITSGRASTPTVSWRIEQAEYDTRVARVRQALQERGLDAIVLFHPIRMAYVTGFFHLQTERPMAIVVPLDGDVGALIPQLEQEHIAKAPAVTRIKVYPEYPSGGTKHPMLHLADLLQEVGLTGKRIGYDNDGHHDVNGYQGPLLSEVAEGSTVRARDIVDDLRMVKSESELRLIAESAKWGNLAHRLMQEKIAVGRNEIDIRGEASAEASRSMVATLGPSYQPLAAVFSPPAFATFTAGANTSLPHGLSDGAGLQPGDVLVTYAAADVGGYTSELERTMIIGEPTPEFARYFDLMLQLQDIAFQALRPGRRLAEVEEEVSRAFHDLGVAELQRHHTGHGIGLEGHEAPFIDRGDERVVQEGMVFSVEPGFYVPGLAGFRHSDTVVVRAHGAERLTYYPRDLASLSITV